VAKALTVRRSVDQKQVERLACIEHRQIAGVANPGDVDAVIAETIGDQVAVIRCGDDDRRLVGGKAGAHEVSDGLREKGVVLVELNDVIAVLAWFRNLRERLQRTRLVCRTCHRSLPCYVAATRRRPRPC